MAAPEGEKAAGEPGSRRLPVLGAGPPAGKPRVAGAPRGLYHIETWGCQMNVYDSERLGGQLRALGLERAGGASEADVILLNTCSVRERAVDKLFSRLGRLRRLKERRPGLLIGVAGCVAQQEQDRILGRSPIVDFVLGPRSVASLPRLLAAAAAGARTVDVAMRDDRYDEFTHIERAAGVRARVTVIEGCNKTCAFCIVPFTRGAEVSRRPEAIEDEVRAALATGAREVELLGQNVNAYRHDDTDFARLLGRVAAIPGVDRLRFATSHPRELTDRVIGAMADSPSICNHLHLPVQSGSDAVLKRMYRGYDRRRYLERAACLRREVRGIALSTDIIVGFPGETGDEFADTLRLLDEVEFDQVFAFVYSPRPGTRALAMSDGLPAAEKEARLARLFAHQETISRRCNERQVGRTVEVLVEGPSKYGSGLVSGRTTDNRVVNAAGGPDLAGRLVAVRITAAHAHSLHGEIVAAVN